MRIFQAFIIIMAAVILFLLPLTLAMYDFQTDLRVDSITGTTGVGETSDNVVLGTTVYDDDTTTITVVSDLGSDNPAAGAYASGSHTLNVTGLTANTTRTLTISYDVDALAGSTAIATLSDKIAWIFLLMAIIFPPTALYAIFAGKGR